MGSFLQINYQFQCSWLIIRLAYRVWICHVCMDIYKIQSASIVNIEVFFRGVENSYIVSKLVSLEKEGEKKR